jgi:hypothetical protein
MKDIKIRLVVEGNTKSALDDLEDLTDAEKKAAENFKKMGEEGKKASDKISKGVDKNEKDLYSLNSTLASVGSAIAGAFAVDRIIDFTKSVIDVTASFEKYSVVLKNVLGSQEASELAMKQIQTIAAKTPFSVDQLTASYVKLVNQGFKPTSSEIVKLGDLAASQGKEFDQLTEALIDAQVGEFERLKEFGIRASKEGDKVTFTFKEQKKVVDFNNESIRDYILSLGDLQGVQGGMAAISETLTGKISNLGDSWDRMLVSIGNANSGVFKSTLDFFGELITNISETNEVANELDRILGYSSAALGQVFGGLIKQLGEFRVNLNETAKSESDYSQAILRLDEAKRKLNASKPFDAMQIRIYNDAIVKLSKDKADYINRLNQQAEKEKAAAIEAERLKKAMESKIGPYDRLSKSIGDYNKKLLDQLTVSRNLNKEDLRRFLILEQQKKNIDAQLEAQRRPTDRMKSIDIVQKEIDKSKELNEVKIQGNKKDAEAIDFAKELKDKEDQKRMIIQESFNLAFALSNAIAQNELNNIQRVTQAQIDAEQTILNNKLQQAGITQQKREEYEKNFEAKRLQIQKQAFEKEKQVKTAQALIEGALAVVRTFASYGGFTPAAIIAASAQAAQTAIQVGVIQAQKFEKGGWIDGKRHSEGGTIIEAERDEFVVNRKDARTNSELLEAINKGNAHEYINRKFVMPAIIKKSIGEVQNGSLADNIAASLRNQMFDDHKLRKTITETSKRSALTIVEGLKQNQRPSRYN